MKPTIGRIVIYRSRTGNYDCPAKATATRETLHRPNVEAGLIADLSGDSHVHLTVFTPGKPGKRAAATDFKTESPHGRAENSGGLYQEWDIAHDDSAGPGTWRWPERVR